MYIKILHMIQQDEDEYITAAVEAAFPDGEVQQYEKYRSVHDSTAAER